MCETNDANSKKCITIKHPWRRFGARLLDLATCHLMLFLLLPGLFEENSMMIMRYLLDILLLLTVEAISLAYFGTTVGKFIFGISVTDFKGRRLTLENAVKRTALVVQHGLGFNIPFLSQYLQWKSLKAIEEGHELPWESESEVKFRDSSNWRYLLFFALIIPITLYPLLCGIEVIGNAQSQVEAIEETFPKPNEHSELLFNSVRNSYRVSEVLYSAEGNYDLDELPILIFDDSVLMFSYNSSSITNTTISTMKKIGTFVYTPSEKESSTAVWESKNESSPGSTYLFRFYDDGYFLDYYNDTQMQWSWKLVEANTLKVRLYSKHAEKSRYPSWWKVDTFDTSYVIDHATHLRYPVTMNLIFQEQNIPEKIVIHEEFYSAGEKTRRDHNITANDQGQFPLDIPLPNLDEESFSIFYIPHEGGEFVICFTYEPGGERWDAFMYDL